MDKITWISPYLDLVLDEIPTDSKNILEVGCGSGIFGFILKKTRDVQLQGVEPFGYDLSHYDHLWRSTWKQYHRTSKGYGVPNHFDVLVCNETVEHMEKNDALSFLHEAKQSADKVIIVTPYKFDEQPAYDDNEYQKHMCAVSTDDFESEGYTVKLIGHSNRKGFDSRILYTPQTNMITKLIGVTPTNIMAVWENLTSDGTTKNRVK